MKIRVHKDTNYTTISTLHLKRKDMSLKAKGLLSLMLALSDDWEYSIKGLCTICQENETAIKSALEELKACGYLVVKKILPTKKNGGRLSYEYDIYEEPQIQEGEIQGVENLGVEFLGVENHVQLKQQYTNTSNTKTSKNNIYIGQVAEIIAYLNDKLHTKYSAKSAANVRLIMARLKDGYTVENFKTVIDKKYSEWNGTEFAAYLRPQTLFGTKFDSYLNAPIRKKTQNKTNAVGGVEIERRQYSDDEMNGLFTELD